MKIKQAILQSLATHQASSEDGLLSALAYAEADLSI